MSNYKKKIIDLYNKRFQDSSISNYKKLGWGSKKSQDLRFKIIINRWDLRNSRILDIGCGFGDFYNFLKKNNIRTKFYTGLDINENFISHCKKKFKNIKQIEFILSDFINYKIDKKFDFIFFSGTYNLKISNNYREVSKIITKMYESSINGCSFNLLSNYVDYKNSKDFHYNVSKIFDISKKISPYVSLLHDYKLYEFTINIRKNQYEY